MSRGFVKEPEPDAPPEPLPEIPVPPPPNPVTARGLARIEVRISELEAKLARSSASREPGAGPELRRQLRYWRARRRTAEVTPPPSAPEEVGFASRVTVAWPGRGEVAIEIVGEDESEPTRGRISWRAPLAAALLGAGVGEKVEATLGGREVELAILAVENAGSG